MATEVETSKLARKSVFTLSNLALLIGGTMALLRLMRAQSAVDFRGRVALITGGSRGLGLNIARQLAEQGARLVLVARKEDELARAARELKAMGAEVLTVVADVTDKDSAHEAIKRAIARFGHLDLLVNNAGAIQIGPLENMVDEDFKAALDLHFWASYYLCRAALPYLKKGRQGRIVNIASFGGQVAVPHMAPYVTSKFALVGFSDALRHEVAKDGVKVTTVCPGVIRTGSHLAATFKGRHAVEYRMFKLASGLPGGAVQAENSARLIVDAARHGDPYLTFPLPMFWGSILYRALPNFAGTVLGVVARFMPKYSEEPEGDKTIPGHDLESALPPSVLTQLADRAAAQHNELNGHALEKSR